MICICYLLVPGEFQLATQITYTLNNEPHIRALFVVSLLAVVLLVMSWYSKLIISNADIYNDLVKLIIRISMLNSLIQLPINN